jgi:predicted phosphodiesterase
MRLAVFSDVHGNAPALAAVLAEVDRLRPDLVLNLGDVASGAVDPRGTLDMLLPRAEIMTIRGNHERQLLERAPAAMSGIDRLAYAAMAARDREWFASLPAQIEPVPGVLAVHGAPGDDLPYLLETVTADGLREATDAEVVERLGSAAGRFDVYLCGHTHLQRTRRLPDGSLVVNPGSVGWPAFADDDPYPHRVEAGSPEARYCVLEQGADGWAASQRRVTYDFEAAALLAERNSRPDIARALRTGLV